MTNLSHTSHPFVNPVFTRGMDLPVLSWMGMHRVHSRVNIMFKKRKARTNEKLTIYFDASFIKPRNCLNFLTNTEHGVDVLVKAVYTAENRVARKLHGVYCAKKYIDEIKLQNI